jgi:hypothetical protein
MKSCLFKGHRVHQGSNREEFLCVDRKDYFLCKSNKRLKVVQITLNRSVFFIEKISRLIWKPCTYTFSHFVISKCLKIWAQCKY